MTFVRNILEKLYDERTSDPHAKKKFSDVFQLLLNANEAESSPVDANGPEDEANKRMSKIEVLAQSFVMLIAGYETTGNTLHYAAYFLAKHQDVQKRVQEEIDRVVGGSTDVTYDHVSNMPYLNKVICEVLRICRPAIQTDRDCGEAITVNGILFENGTVFIVPIYAVHHDPEYFPEPENFDPERFSPAEKARRDPLAYLPFGHGPRNCDGHRLAEIELRTTLAVLPLTYYSGLNATASCRRQACRHELEVELEGTGLPKTKHALYAVAERR